MRVAHVFGAVGFFLFAACGGSTADTSNSGTAHGDAGGVGNGGDGSSQADGGSGTPPSPVANASVGTYIALGDSISDRGGQGPFYYDLLLKNDDAKYPTWKGKDLSTKWPGIQYVHGAIAGSVTGPYTDRTSAATAPRLSDQIKKLGSTYPGDVLVTITIGGNDLNAHAGDAVVNQDAADKTQFTSNLQAALAELTKPGRLGTGKVYVVQSNIYDASDGQGNWRTGGPRCPQFDTGSKLDTQVFDAWNKIVQDAVTATPNDTLLDLRALFHGHGFNNASDNWYFTDCIHPNTKGHQYLRREAWRIVTGEDVAAE